MVYDPATTQTNPSGGGVIRTPFPGNQIPASLFNPAAVRLIDLYPSPNLPGLASNYLLAPVNTTANDQGSGKIDHVFGDVSRAFFRFTRAYSGDVNARALGPRATPFVGVSIPVTSRRAQLHPHLYASPDQSIALRNLAGSDPERRRLGVTNTAQQFGIPNVNVGSIDAAGLAHRHGQRSDG